MIDLKKLVEAGVHFGHHSSKWHPKMKPYIWGTKNKVHLINVAKTAFLLDRAEKFLEAAAAEGKQVLWVGTKKSAQPLIRAIAEKLSSPFVYHRWIGGTLSNYDQVKKAITRLLHLRDAVAKATGSRMTKKEQSVMVKEIERLEKNVGGIATLTGLPAALVIVDAKKERAAIREANRVGVPVVCLVDTNTDPSGVSYLIPANDDSSRSIEVIFEHLATGVKRGQEVAQQSAAEAAAKAQAERAARRKAADDKKATEDATRKAAAPAKAPAGKTARPHKKEESAAPGTPQEVEVVAAAAEAPAVVEAPVAPVVETVEAAPAEEAKPAKKAPAKTEKKAPAKAATAEKKPAAKKPAAKK